jgi:hypothetical protein
LQIRANGDAVGAASARDKSLLLLFFRKEDSSFLKKRSKELLLFWFDRVGFCCHVETLMAASFHEIGSRQCVPRRCDVGLDGRNDTFRNGARPVIDACPYGASPARIHLDQFDPGLNLSAVAHGTAQYAIEGREQDRVVHHAKCEILVNARANFDRSAPAAGDRRKHETFRAALP